MTVSRDRRELYENMTEEERMAVDAAFEAADNALLLAGFDTAGDDRAENLVGAIARYVEDSKN